jgi:hypothetical protein
VRFIKSLILIQPTGEAHMSLNSDWQNFLNESLDEKNIFTYIQGLQEIISNLKPRTMTEKRRLQLAKTHLREVKKFARRMQTDMNILQEKVNLIEESQGDE